MHAATDIPVSLLGKFRSTSQAGLLTCGVLHRRPMKHQHPPSQTDCSVQWHRGLGYFHLQWRDRAGITPASLFTTDAPAVGDHPSHLRLIQFSEVATVSIALEAVKRRPRFKMRTPTSTSPTAPYCPGVKPK
jgi:hypothetical protein